MTLDDLLAAPSFGLTLATPRPGPDVLARSVSFAATTELLDPSPYLSGGELVLTTGVRLHSEDAQRDFVRAIEAVGAAALGFGIGRPESQLSHGSIPAPMLDEAVRLGLPLLQVPEATPFVAIGKEISARIAEQHSASLSSLLAAHQKLAAALVSGGRDKGQAALLAVLAQITRGPLQLHRYGSLIHAVDAAAPASSSAETPDSAWTKQPIPTGYKDRAALWSAVGADAPEYAASAVDYARSLLGVELANENRALVRERQAAGQIIQDVMTAMIRGAEAQARLRSIGIDDGAHHVIVVTVPSGQRRALASLPVADGRESSLRELGVVRTALVGDRLLIVALSDATDALLDVLYRAGLTARVGVSRPYQWAGLKWAWHEALGAAKEASVGQAVAAGRLSMMSLLLASQDAPTTEFAEQTIGMLAGGKSELMDTLRAYLQRNGAVQEVAAELGVHRNSIRYRLESIHQLTGHDPTTFDGATHLNLALKAWDVAHPAGRTTP